MNKGINLVIAGAIALSIGASLSGCNSGKSKAAASASAEASVLAHNPKVLAAKKKWQPVVEGCAQSQRWLGHPFQSAEYVYGCMTKHLTSAQKIKLKTCATNAIEHNGFNHAATKDVNSIILCAAQVAPNGPKVTK